MTNVIFFDWNGTLLADTAHTFKAVNAALQHIGHAHTSFATFQRCFTLPLSEFYRQLGVSEDEFRQHYEAIQGTWIDSYRLLSARPRMRRGAHQSLSVLSNAGHHNIVLSNHNYEDIVQHAARLKIDGYLHGILANSSHGETTRSHGKGWRLEEYSRCNNIKRAIIVGDTVEEIEIAREFGYIAVALTGGYCSTQRLREAKPDYLLNHLQDLPAIAQRVFA